MAETRHREFDYFDQLSSSSSPTTWHEHETVNFTDNFDQLSSISLTTRQRGDKQKLTDYLITSPFLALCQPGTDETQKMWLIIWSTFFFYLCDNLTEWGKQNLTDYLINFPILAPCSLVKIRHTESDWLFDQFSSSTSLQPGEDQTQKIWQLI